jgi:type I restriction enzyme, S subunit
MIEKYDSYKESGIKWMGKIPSNWLLTKNRYGFKKHNNGKNEKDDTPVLSLTTKGVKVKTNLNFGKSTESYIGHQLVEKGDIVFTPRDFDQTPILSDVSKYNGCISNLYIVDKVKKEVLNHFVNYYWHGLKYSVDYFKNFSHGIRHSFNRFQFDEIPLLIPPISEQKLICCYLDKKTEQIDKLIDKIQRKIELLKEQHISLINQYVTKGLNLNVEMKDSGVDWISKIPKHWDISPMFTLFDENKIKNKKGRQDVLTLSYGKIKYRDLSKLGGLFPESFKGYQVMTLESIIIRSTDLQNDHKSLRVGHVGLEGVITSAYLGLKPKEEINTKYYYYSIHLADLKKVLYGLGGGLRQSLRYDDFKRFPILNPPKIEREEISKCLDNIDNKTNTLIDKLDRKISLLKDYRQSLISFVVTGKIRLTEHVT